MYIMHGRSHKGFDTSNTRDRLKPHRQGLAQVDHSVTNPLLHLSTAEHGGAVADAVMFRFGFCFNSLIQPVLQGHRAVHGHVQMVSN